MYTIQPKKLLIINILDILKRYTDADHRLSQKEIQEILEREYDMKVDRKAVKRNLMNLIDFGYDIEYSESIRINKKSEEETMLSDFNLNRDFDDSELRLLIDSLLFSKHIPYNQCRTLVEKLENLSSVYFHSRVKHICTLPNDKPDNNQLFYTIDILDEAISKKRQVEFVYNEAGTDKKKHPRKYDNGEIKKYVVNPYQMVTANGRYYLICNYDKYDDVSNYRLDRISDIKMLPTPLKSHSKVKGIENGLNLPRHMAEHVYMFTGRSIWVKFRAEKHLLNDLADWFSEADYSDITDDALTVSVKVNEKAMFYWAMQYSPYIEILEPFDLRKRVGTALREAAEKYEK